MAIDCESFDRFRSASTHTDLPPRLSRRDLVRIIRGRSFEKSNSPTLAPLSLFHCLRSRSRDDSLQLEVGDYFQSDRVL